MCGIIGFTGHRQALPILLESLARLEYRGYDSAGVALESDGRAWIRKSEGRIQNLVRLVAGKRPASTCGIGHTRWATHGAPNSRNAHPHLDCSGKIAVVHNGIIENFETLKRELARRGHRFRSATDSEMIAHLLEERRGEDPQKALAAVFRRLRGQFAIVAMDAAHPGQIVAARSGPPLLIGLGRNEHFFASDAAAILPYTRHVVFLEDGDVAWITPDTRKTVHKGSLARRSVHHIQWNAETAEKGGHPHFMLKEILDQPETILNSLSGRILPSREQVCFGEEERVGRLRLEKVDRVVLVACGTAWHASLVGRQWIEQFAGIPATAELASEFRYASPVLTANTLVVAVSQSGETADTLASARLARRSGCRVLAVANTQGSTLTREADAVIWMRAGVEIGVAATKTYTAQLVALLLFAVHFGRVRGKLNARHSRSLLADALGLPGQVKTVLRARPQIRSAARRLSRYPNFMFVGRGLNFPTVLEGALKLKEISYRHAEGYGAGEMKHGPLALVDARLPVVAVCCGGEEVFNKTVSNLHQIRARGASLVVVTDRSDFRLSAGNTVLRIQRTRPELSPILAVVPLQLLAYELAVDLKRDIDKPRNLAKSVTVE